VAGLLGKRKLDGVVVAVLQACSAVTMSTVGGSASD